jgi:pimeloyl-ACP methyl ester carboxylesterase
MGVLPFLRIMRRGKIMWNLLEQYKSAISALSCDAALESYTINGLGFNAVAAGAKGSKLILLLHGFPECWYSWRKQIPALVQAGYRVVAPDLRGYGMNDKPERIDDYHISLLTDDVRQIISKEGAESAIIVGHDWGGAVAWNLAMSSPELVDQLIILNAPHPVTFSRELKDRISEQYKMSWYIRFFQKLSWPEKVLASSPSYTANWFFRRKWVSSPDAFTDRDLALYAATYAIPGSIQAMLNWYRASFRYRSGPRPILQPIHMKTLVIWGQEDQVLSQRLLEGLDEWVLNLEVIRIEHAGHFVQNEAPDYVTNQLLDFLNR